MCGEYSCPVAGLCLLVDHHECPKLMCCVCEEGYSEASVIANGPHVLSLANFYLLVVCLVRRLDYIAF